MPSNPLEPASVGNCQGQTGGGGGGAKTPRLGSRRGLMRSARAGRAGHWSPSRGKPSRSAMVLLYSAGVRARGAASGGEVPSAAVVWPAGASGARIPATTTASTAGTIRCLMARNPALVGTSASPMDTARIRVLFCPDSSGFGTTLTTGLVRGPLRPVRLVAARQPTDRFATEQRRESARPGPIASGRQQSVSTTPEGA